MKICIIGNSHVGSLKRGWDQITRNYSNIQLTFFAHRNNGLADLVVKDSTLVAANEELEQALLFTSSGKGYICPNEYDIFLLYGLNAKAYLFGDCFYSESAIRSSVRDFITVTLSYKIFSLLCGVTNKPIYIGHNPLPAAVQVKNRKKSDYVLGMDILRKYSPLCSNGYFVNQPEDTVVNSSLTNPCYSLGSKRLAIGEFDDNEEHPLNDNMHMNDEFGILWLENFFSMISKMGEHGT
ncbi:hypothetical protein [Neptunomonas concharum]|uniref:SGNH/GDSL hydrolase family protein n=1 Tax=Neptunomonas concharum TaxID=1031538 RepID=A0A5P1R9A0_9GAMM|nr:hypothetical protein [Neptunomonas concharum]QEQ95872.1 hypothetical protein F0U83_03660 [Neptunomonas concharum]